MSDGKVKAMRTLSEEEQRKLNETLYDSARKGSVQGVEETLSFGADINYQNSSGQTPLFIASLLGRTKVVILLLKYQADPNISDKHDMTPLHMAGNKGIAESLINNGANVNLLSKDRNTVLHTACRQGCATALIDYLILKGLSVESRNKYGETPLHLSRNENTAKYLVDQYGADINALTDDGNTVLHTACSNYIHLDILDYLIKTKGFKFTALNKYGETPLHLAHDEWTAKHLVDEYGADINVLTDDDNTVLHTVFKYRHHGSINLGSFLTYLIETKGLKLDSLNKSNQTPINILKLPSDDETVSEWRSQCLRWLQQEGHKDLNDYIPLWKKAAEEGIVDTIWTNVSIGGASGVGKTSFACLVLDQPPPKHHHSTDVIQPLPVYTVVDTPHNGKDKATGNNPNDDELDDDGIAGHTTTDTTSKKEGPARVQDTSKSQTTASSNLEKTDGVRSHMVLTDGQCQWKMANRMELYMKLAKCALAHKLKQSKETPEMPAPQDGKNPATSHPNSTTSTQPVSPPVPNTSEPVNRLPKDVRIEKERIRHIEELQSSREVLKLIDELETCDKLDETHFVHLLDTGGQASLIDIAPALVRFNSVNILVLKLDEPLTDTVNFFYSVDGEVKGREYRNMTNEELLASLIAARRNIKKPEIPGLKEDDLVKPKLIIIGTHYDRYKEKERNKELKETIREKEEQLMKLLNLEEADCYYYNPEESQFIFPVNTMLRESEESKIASQIRQIACQTYMRAPIPLKWYLVQLELNQMKAENKDIVQVKEIVEFGFDIFMDEEAVRASLKYFHVLTICLYFPQVLPDIVFLSPDYLAKQIGRIAAVAMCKSEHGRLTNTEINRLVDEGIFEVSLLGKIGMEFAYKSFTVDDFMKLLEHLFVVIRTTDKRCSYFMPSLLPISRENILETLPQSSEVDPVSLKWENAMPSGMLSSVSMAMCQSTVTPIEKPPREPQYRNKITLRCRDLKRSLVLFEYAKCLGVVHDGLAKDSPIVLKAVMEGIKSVVDKFNWVEGVSQPSVGFLIPSSPPDGDGTIYHYYQRSDRNRDRLVHEESGFGRSKQIEINKERQLPWFQKVPNDKYTDMPLFKPSYSEESNQPTSATAVLTDLTHLKSHSTTEHNQGQRSNRYCDYDMPLSDDLCKQFTPNLLRHPKSSTQQCQLHKLEEQSSHESFDGDDIPLQKRPKFEPSNQVPDRSDSLSNVSEPTTTCLLGTQSESLQSMQTQDEQLLKSRKRRNNKIHSGHNPKRPSIEEPPICFSSPNHQAPHDNQWNEYCDSSSIDYYSSDTSTIQTSDSPTSKIDSYCLETKQQKTVLDGYKVFDLLSDKSAQWKKIGRTMQVEHNYRDSLQNDPRLDDDDHLERVIYKWVESTTPSWDQFIAVLKKLQYNDVITSVQEQYE